ncbi:MAG: hypothetical protein PHS97_00710 [Oscillospiraceae bacterium]|nr:hypothetical protein [Oscillospiraceae bacterium]
MADAQRAQMRRGYSDLNAMTASTAPQRTYRELPVAQPRPKAQPRPAAKPKRRISVFVMAACFSAAFLVLLVITSYAQWYELTSQTAALQDQISQGLTTQTALRSTYESKIDLDYVEQQATTQLGMSQPAANQIVHLDLCGPDHAQVLSVESEVKHESIFSALKNSVAAMVGYIRAYFS